MRASNNFFFGIFVLLSLACEDIIEEDISGDMLQVSYPSNNAIIESNIVNFQWNGMDGADSYRIQVYSGNAMMALDSLVTATNFAFPLSGGGYQWRVRAENSAYESLYSFPASFTVVESSDLTNQQVVLTSPANGFYTNIANITCAWQQLAAADAYHFQLFNVTAGQNLVLENDQLAVTSMSLSNSSLLQEAEYQWKVRARNADSQTAAFSSRNFYIDRTSPNQPQLGSPSNESEQTSGQPISFVWNISPDSGPVQSPLRYTIEFSNTATFSSIMQSTPVNSTSFEQAFTAAGNYFWRVRANDQAGNLGSYSSAFKFTID